MKDYVWLVLAWGTYFFVHSILAANSVKNFFKELLGRGFRLYRIFYSIIATIGLLALLLFNATLPSDLLLPSSGMIRYLSLMLATFGVVVISQTFREHSALGFLGLKAESKKFIRSGILNKARHPIYSGTILIVVGFFLFIPTVATLLSTLCILSYLPIGIYLEEKKLLLEFGDSYAQYQSEVPALIPDFRKRV
jgi:protein-S-isoprenylcysteine O-methyltransferase Ste14